VSELSLVEALCTHAVDEWSTCVTNTSASRSRLQTAAVLLRSKGVVGNDCGKGVPSGRQVSVEEMSESKPFDDASLILLDAKGNDKWQKPRGRIPMPERGSGLLIVAMKLL